MSNESTFITKGTVILNFAKGLEKIPIMLQLAAKIRIFSGKCKFCAAGSMFF